MPFTLNGANKVTFNESVTAGAMRAKFTWFNTFIDQMTGYFKITSNRI